MPTNATSRFLPPGTDNELEGIILDAAKLQWPAIEFSPNSVNGQAQNGVDIYGMTPEGRWIGIECKNSIRELRQDVIRDAVRAADTFRPPLERLYIATTAPDGSADEFIRKLTQDRLQAGKFPVFIWRWKQMVGALGRDLPTLYHHFPEQRPADWFFRGGLSPALRGNRIAIKKIPARPWQLLLTGLAVLAGQFALVVYVIMDPGDHQVLGSYLPAMAFLGLLAFGATFVPGGRLMWTKSMCAFGWVIERGADGYVYLAKVKFGCPKCGGEMKTHSALTADKEQTARCVNNHNHEEVFDMTLLVDVASAYRARARRGAMKG